MLFETKHSYTTEQITTLKSIRTNIIQHLSLHNDPKLILWFLGNCGVVNIDDKYKKIDIGLPNEFIMSQIKKFFTKGLKSAVQQTYNQQFWYDLVIYEPFQSKNRNDLQIDIKKLLKIPTSVLKDDKTPAINSKSSIPTRTLGYGLQHQLSFSNIIGGSHIDFALSAARAVAENPGKTYNPLFIYGHVGLGKTHLLNAIGNVINKDNKKKNIVFMPTTELIDHIVLGIRKNKLTSFLNQFKKIDILLLDDIQFLGNKDKTQEVFLNLFNEMHNEGKQIVLTSDRPPRELNSIEARLKSRFNLWLVCDIKEPDFETRLAILQAKVALKGDYISSEYLTLIAKHITSNVRELEGAVNILLTKKQFTQEDITIDAVHDCLRTLWYRIQGEQTISLEEMSTLNTRSLMNFWTLVEYVAAYYNLAIADLKSDKRTREISLARQMLMVIAKQEFWRTYEKIGDYFGGKNHATVIYAVKQFPKKLKADPSLNHDYTLVLEQVEK